MRTGNFASEEKNEMSASCGSQQKYSIAKAADGTLSAVDETHEQNMGIIITDRLLSLPFEPTRSVALKLQATDDISRLLYKTLSRQDASRQPITSGFSHSWPA